MSWNWGSTATTQPRRANDTRSAWSRTRRKDLIVQVELSTIVARDRTDNIPTSTSDSKVRGPEISQETIPFGSIGSVEVDRAEEGVLVGTDKDMGDDRSGKREAQVPASQGKYSLEIRQ